MAHLDDRGKPIAFHDLPASAFPLVIEFLRGDTGEVVLTEVVSGPGVLRVPALAKALGVPIAVRVITADHAPPNRKA